MPVTPDLPSLLRLCDAATPGARAIHRNGPEDCSLGDGLYVDSPDGKPLAFAASGNPGDAALIAALDPATVRALVEMAQRGQAALTAALPFIEEAAQEQQSYGYFLGGMVDGDPRCFDPDPECSTEAEMQAHKADCEAWNRGERPRHVVMSPIDPDRSIALQVKGADSAALERDAEGNVTGGHVHRAGYGLGTTTFRDPEAVAALEQARAALEVPRG